MARYITDDAALRSVADAIRLKGKTVDVLTFPDGFTAAINSIETGGAQPQLYAPTVSLSGRLMTVVPNASNGAFVDAWNVYVKPSDGDYSLGTTVPVSTLTVDLSQLSLPLDNYKIRVTATGESFRESNASNAVELGSAAISSGTLKVEIQASAKPDTPETDGTEADGDIDLNLAGAAGAAGINEAAWDVAAAYIRGETDGSPSAAARGKANIAQSLLAVTKAVAYGASIGETAL